MPFPPKTLAELPVLVLSGRGAATTVRCVIAAATSEQLQNEVLSPYLANARWFAGKGQVIRRSELMVLGELTTDHGSWLLTVIEVCGDDLLPQCYFLPLANCWENDSSDEQLLALMPWALARVRQKERSGLLCEAFGDDRFCRALLDGISQNLTLSFGKGRIEFRAFQAFADRLNTLDAPVRHPALEQSNTAVYFGDQLFLKAYRRLQVGTNPEVEIGRFLTEQSPFAHSVPVAGAIELCRDDGQKQTLAILQTYVDNQGSLWDFAVDYLERFLADQAGGSPLAAASPHAHFLALMSLLGRRTAELHLAFARPTGNPAFEPEPISADDLTTWSAQLRDEAVTTLDALEKRRSALGDELRSAADRLLARRQLLLGRVSPAALAGIVGAKMRYHGDYHLGQVLRVGEDLVITDFEGEPARSLAERGRKHSPLRDVAGMLRSLSYVAAVAANHATLGRPADRRSLGALGCRWERQASQAFLQAYREAIAECPAWPAAPGAADRLIQFFVVEKALYELRYEMNNRPEWLSIPLHSLLRQLGGEPGQEGAR